MIFGKKYTYEEKKNNIKEKINKLLTDDIKYKIWNHHYNYTNEFHVYCCECKRRKTNPFECKWMFINENIINEENIKPVCEYCDILNDNKYIFKNYVN